jgi:hypothetical protein
VNARPGAIADEAELGQSTRLTGEALPERRRNGREVAHPVGAGRTLERRLVQVDERLGAEIERDLSF